MPYTTGSKVISGGEAPGHLTYHSPISPSLPGGDPRDALLKAPLSTYQRVAIAVTVMLCALDGFDVLAVTYAAPGFLTEWGLNSGQLGIALSMGLVGMALGSFLLAPLADRIGRRRMIFVCLAIMAGGMAASALAGSLGALAFWRIITGVGIGAMICVINPLAAEYANERRRDLAIALMAVGYPIGGTVGGILSAHLLELYDWRAIFWLGAGLALAMVPLVIRWIPEPVGYLIENPGPDALEKVNRFLRRCHLPETDRLPAPSPRQRKAPLAEIFSPAMRRQTLHLTTIYALYLMTVYFFLSWTPQLVADLGFSAAVSATVAVTRDTAGIVGGVALGWAAHYLGLKRLALAVLAGMGLTLILFGRLPADLDALRITAALAGLCLYGGMISLYAVIARTFPTHVRASGTGFVIGVGRVTSAMAPLLGGFLFDIGLDRGGVTTLLACGALVAAGLMLAYRVRPIGAE
ncbi:MFS transporter [Kineobactrum salinum]|uniref:MFS transporter n=1 Tax=Kineobactrum salinum TaxID=2708301 RepID=A0A6C0U471_9GAMM|nr:MFS transporter [Kineobactrum salinum]QIB66911.1 MFS transporter [Kineobactrum salinum]